VSAQIDGALFALFDGLPASLPDWGTGSGSGSHTGGRDRLPPATREGAAVLTAVKDKPFGWPPRVAAILDRRSTRRRC
jgi:hypothetical protein